MSRIKVDINAGGHQVVVEHDGADDLDVVAARAQQLWETTRLAVAPPRADVGGGLGFVLAERAPQWDHERQRPTRAAGPPVGR